MNTLVIPAMQNARIKTFRRLPVGEKIAIILFVITCFQAAFLQPDITLIPGERSKLFTGVLCLLSLVACLLLVRKPSGWGSFREASMAAVLTILVAASGALSLTPLSSSLRGFVVASSALGGFWCARILLGTTERQKLFTGLCLALLAGIIGLSILGYVSSGKIIHFLDVNPHPIACRMLLLSFAPLTLLLCGSRTQVIFGATLMCVGYAVFFISNLRSASLIPIILGAMAVVFGYVRAKHFVVILIPLSIVLALFFYSLPPEKIGREYEPAYYRAENYPFGMHIALKHPFLGIGLRAPREGFLEDYEVKYPYVTKEKFGESVRHIVTSENIFLNFLVDLGIPFLIIYTTAVAILVLRLLSAVRRPDPEAFLPPLALLLPICAGLLHFQVLDGLLHPHISWFFHILLGLIPHGGSASEN